MKNKLLSLYKKYEEYISYFIVGVCTTFVSLFSKYLLLFTIFSSDNPFQLQLSVIISWFCAVSFAYVTNRKIVFKSKDKNIFREILTFFMVRVSTLMAESLILWFFITLLGLNSNFYVVIWTLLSQVIIFIGNYILSKYVIFNEKGGKLFSKKNIFFIILIVLVFILSYMFPYTHDDWAWGSSIGIDRLTTLFKDYNGRWLGNLLVILLTRNRILRSLVITSVFTGIVFYISKILNVKNNFMKILIIILIFLMPVFILAQAVAWTSGFSNYVVGVLLTLIYLNYNKEELLDNKNKVINYKNIILYFILGFSSSLFIEHVTIYNVLISILFLILGKVIKKRITKINLSYMIGAILGAFLMFSNSAYYNVINNQDSYRQVGQNSMKIYFDELSQHLFINNHFINIFVGILCLILIYGFLNKRKKIKNLYKKLLYGVCLFILMFLCLDIYYVFINDIKLISNNLGNFFNNDLLISSNIFNVLNGIIYGLYWILIFIIVLFLINDKKIKFRMFFELLSIVTMAAPLLVVKPIGPRCFFPIYIFFVIFAVDLFNYVFIKKINKIDNLNIFLKSICVILLSFNIFIYGIAFSVEIQRKNYIDNNKDNDLLVLPEIPSYEYMQMPNPTTDTFTDRFKLFYNIDKDVKLKFVPYNTWIK